MSDLRSLAVSLTTTVFICLPPSGLSAALIDFEIDPATDNSFVGDVVSLKGDEYVFRTPGN